MGLGIEQVTIIDALTERAKTCTTVLAPLTRIGAPIGEFQFPGDTQSLSGTSIRPNGATLDVLAGYGTVPLHTIFTGTVEEMDDLEDADLYNYTIVLSAIPPSQNHRLKLTLLYDFPLNEIQASPITTTRQILMDACKAAGIPLGRCDLPSVQVYGNYEVIRKNICEIAEEFCQPFNTFDYKHYYVRVSERDGLSIVAIDYTKGGEVSNLYEVENVEQKTRTFQRYMPDNRIGDSDVLLIGADMYGPDPNAENSLYETTYHTYHTDSRQDNEAAGTDQWTETETTIEFLVQLTLPPGIFLPTVEPDIDGYINLLAQGGLANISIIAANSTHVLSKTSDVDGLIQQVETWYSYNAIKFPMHIYKTGERVLNVLVYEETLTSLYPDNNEFNQTLVKRWYGYSDSGVQNSTVTRTYYNDGRDAWILQDMSLEGGESQGLTSALIQFYVDRAQTRLVSASALRPEPPTTIGKYQLLNGEHLGVNTPPKISPYDPTAAQFEEEQREKRCFQMSIPYMGWDGLDLIWAMCVRQKELETTGVYWESVKATATIDTSPAAGESVIVSDSSGICNSIEHAITGDAAMTTLSVSRLITPAS